MPHICSAEMVEQARDVHMLQLLLGTEKMKHCFKCGEVKNIEEFYSHSEMGDKHLGKCKNCTKKDSRDRIERMKSDPEWVKQERERSRIKIRKARDEGRYLTHPKSRLYRKKWASLNRHKVKAQLAAKRAYRRGRITKPAACESCGKITTKLEKHHPDYSRPLFIQWLCKPCHALTWRKDVA